MAISALFPLFNDPRQTASFKLHFLSTGAQSDWSQFNGDVMARGKINKAAKIREAFDSLGADARPKDVIATLAARKIKVAPAQVSAIRSSLNGKGKKGSGRRGNKGADLIALSDLQAAKRLIEALGSIERARGAIDALAKLR